MAPPRVHLSYQLYNRRKRMAEDILLRRQWIEKQHAATVSAERDRIRGAVNSLAPGTRKAYLAMRLERINQQMGA